MSTTVTSKGQVTIPKPIRDSLGLEPGSRVEFVREEDGKVVLLRDDGDSPAKRIARVRGSLPSDMSTDEIMALLRGDD